MTRRKEAEVAEALEKEDARPPDLTRERRALVKAAHDEAKGAADEVPKLAAQARREQKAGHIDEASAIASRAHAMSERARMLPEVTLESITGIRIDVEGASIGTFATGHKLRLPKGGELQVLTGPGTVPNEELLDLEG